MSNPWAYKINYDAAITSDEAEIARLQAILALDIWSDKEIFATLLVTCSSEYGFDTETIRVRMGLSESDVDSICIYNDVDAPYNKNFRPKYAEMCRVGDALENKWGTWSSKEGCLKNLKRAKASLARHRRNQQKNG